MTTQTFPTRADAEAFFKRQRQATMRSFNGEHFVFSPSSDAIGHPSTLKLAEAWRGK